MRAIMLLCLTPALLTACTVKETVVRQEPAAPAATVYQAAPPVVQAPTGDRAATIAYTVMGEHQFNQAAVQAANWCKSNYGTDARLVDRSQSTAGDLVTFACMS